MSNGELIIGCLLNIRFGGQSSVLILALLLLATAAAADPENFMVDELTFVRPPKWQWVWDTKIADTGLLLKIRALNTNDLADVYFRKFNGDEGSVEKRTNAWRLTFRESGAQLKMRTETKPIPPFSIDYIEMEGTSLREWRPEYGLMAAIIRMNDGHVVVRMSGRKKVVDESKKAFRAMVERALSDRAAEQSP